MFGAVSGCTSLAQDEAMARAALQNIALGGAWLQTHKVLVDEAFDMAIAYTSGSPTLQKRLQEAKVAYDSGDLATAQAGLAIGLAALQPMTVSTASVGSQ